MTLTFEDGVEGSDRSDSDVKELDFASQNSFNSGNVEDILYVL
jgi:hypothetical protein